jgi:hypothetical protein
MKKTILLRGRIADDLNLKSRSFGIRLNHINETIDSIREWFDGEIILATWNGQEKYIDKINKINKLILLDEPKEGPVGNLKRQVYALNEGLKKIWKNYQVY